MNMKMRIIDIQMSTKTSLDKKKYGDVSLLIDRDAFLADIDRIKGKWR